VAHGNAVADADDVKLARRTARFADRIADQPADLIEMDMKELQTAMNGFLMSSSVKPVACIRLRCGARSRPFLI
jgi:hypothetical protein